MRAILFPSLAADAAHDAAHEVHRRFRHGAYSVDCSECHVKAGVLCLGRRTVHTARRELYRQKTADTTLVPLLLGRAR
ncbi:zinc finger domain-containing protein [Streptomyces rubiginosohelvolus]|uniref:zinc finger domain-containing protein n=1 Tax=Streptomyces rubiginosohelvolus TaxID=67362 RepID=UPI0035D73282